MKNDLNRLTIGISLILIITVVLTYIIMHQNDYNNLVANISDTTPTTTDITTETSITEITTEETILTTEIITEEPYSEIVMTTIPTQDVTTTETQSLTLETTQIETEVTSMDTENYNNIDNYYSSNFISYYNNDFQYSIAYPDNFYVVSSSNDGCTFTNGFATIETYAYYNYEDTCENLYNQDINSISEDISYKLLKSDYYILSWIQNGNVIYRKVFVTNTKCVALEYVYSSDYKSIYDSMIETMKYDFEIY